MNKYPHEFAYASKTLLSDMSVTSKSRHQQGFVLVGALMTMLLLVLVGIVATTSSSLEVQIATADRDSKIAFYNAESGVHYTVAYMRDQWEDDPKQNPEDLFNEVADQNIAMGNGSFLVNNFSEEDGAYYFDSTGIGPSNASAMVRVRFKVEAPPHPSFTTGIVTDGNLNITGGPHIIGSMHANGNINQNGAGTIDGAVSAVGNASVGSPPTHGDPVSGAPPMEIPPITPEDFDYYRSLAQSSPNIYHGDDFELSDSGDLENIIIFVDGDATISGDIMNATIIATGNVTVNGSSELSAADSIGVAMMAGGDIIMNGANDSYGVFWSNGSFVQNGASTVFGSIVSGGNITRNGAFNFEFNGNTDNDNIPTLPPAPTITSWRDMSL